VTLPAFRISRYLVTNAQWRRFMDAGGYADPRWWRWGGEMREAEGWTVPRFWDNAQFNVPNQPVIGVSWYEAQAFCVWLSQHLGYPVALPTEAQWEAAARGPQRPIYPWGDTWDADQANTGESGPGRTTAVGIYPHGANWCGALDMGGNVWEWTRSDYTSTDRSNIIGVINNGKFISLRGGAWRGDWLNSHGAIRLRNGPQFRGNGVGLRIVANTTN